MTTPVTASDIKAAMRASIQQAMPSTPEKVELRGQKADGVPTATLPDKRFTVVMTHSQHHFIKRLAVEYDSDASTITRMLFSLLETDRALANQVRELIRKR
jgi:hypothetical protein